MDRKINLENSIDSLTSEELLSPKQNMYNNPKPGTSKVDNSFIDFGPIWQRQII